MKGQRAPLAQTGRRLLGPPSVLVRGRARTVSGVYKGHEGLRNWFREWFQAWENLDDHYEELIDAGDKVVSLSTMRGRGRVSGVEIDLKHNAGIWTVRRGKVVSVVWFPTREEAFEAAGLRK
jgi:ketosteroid isomerase-like protein